MKTAPMLALGAALIAIGVWVLFPHSSRPVARPHAGVSASTHPRSSAPPSAQSTSSTSATSSGHYPYPGIPRTGRVPLSRLHQPIADATTVADHAVGAYASVDFGDRTGHDWLHRIAPYTTPAFQQKLQRQYGHEPPANPATLGHVRSSVTIHWVDPSSYFTANGTHLTLMVSYTGNQTTKSGHTTRGYGSLIKVVTMRLDAAGKWKVANLSNPANPGIRNE